MEPTSPIPPSIDPGPFEWRPKPSRARVWTRRLVVTSGLGAVGGFLAYPWLLGSRRSDLESALARIGTRLRDRARGNPARVSSRSLPVDRTDPEVIAYEEMLARLELRYLQPIEVIRPHFRARGTVLNTLPPRELWPNIAETLRVADEIRHQVGVPLRAIVSAYRCPAYNAACPGAALFSRHTHNDALDLVYDCEPEKVVTAAEALRDQGVFTGGIGRYASFTHIDTRGVSADWQG